MCQRLLEFGALDASTEAIDTAAGFRAEGSRASALQRGRANSYARGPAADEELLQGERMLKGFDNCVTMLLRYPPWTA